MGFRARLTFIGEVEDDAKNDSIPLLISKLKTAFLPADFERAERALLARESNLKREIEKLKKENAALQESNQFRELEMLRIDTELKEYKTKGVIFELRRKNRELESEKVKLEALVKSEYEGWKGLISKLERDATKLSNEKGLGSTKFEGRSRNCGRADDSGRNNLGVVIKSDNGLNLNENGGMASSAGSSIFSDEHRGLKLSGIRKFSSGDAGLIDSHNECAPKETKTLCEKEISEIHKDTESLGLTGEERKLRVLKRKRASSLSASDDENGGGKFKKDINSISEMNQRQKLSLEPDGLPIKHCTELVDFSGSNDYENQNLPSSHDQVNSRESEEKIMAEQKSQLFFKVPAEVSSDCDNDPHASLSSSCSSSSSDDDDDYLLRSVLDDIMPKPKQEGGAALRAED